MARWIGGGFLDSGTMNIQGFIQGRNVVGLTRYVDILRKEYKDATSAKDKADALKLGKMAQAALVKIGATPVAKEGWADRAAAIYGAEK